MKKEYLQKIRAFNRFYTNVIGLLDRHILNSDYSLIEARILFELYHNKDLTSSDIIELVDIDKGYLSRILKKFESNSLINKVSSSKDKRITALQLTETGRMEYGVLDKASDTQVKNLFGNLSDKECDELVKKITEIQVLIKKSLNNE